MDVGLSVKMENKDLENVRKHEVIVHNVYCIKVVNRMIKIDVDVVN